MASHNEDGIEALRSLKSTDPRSYLEPNPTLSQTARAASQYIFSSLRPFSQKSPLDQLLVDGFDAEQIWQQIDLQSQPIIATLRRRVKHLQKDPKEISKLKIVLEGEQEVEEKTREELNEESDDFDEALDDFDEDDDEEEQTEGKESEQVGTESEEEAGEESTEEEEEEGDAGGVEDKFFKIKELAKYLKEEEENLENDEAGQIKKKGHRLDREEDDEEEEVSDDEGSEDDEDSDEAGDFGLGDSEEEEEEDLENARYEDFFGANKDKSSKRKKKLIQESEESGDEEDDMEIGGQNQETISTHEKQLEKIQSNIEQMEKANLQQKNWIMQGEVTADKRPKNSALEVDLDFDHNMRPPPVITEEVTASIEDMIQKRILEGRFDDVQGPPKLPSKAPREIKELDENKSKKGLAEVYEEDYVQKTNPAIAPLSFKDEQKREASMLFKKLCLKLDALSHFHFTPKPVIEDMYVQANVPALAMEEIAPVAVSDAAMLAPEEVFAGKGSIKEEVELTKEERKRRRANKKRKFKAVAAERMAKKPREDTLPSQIDG
ncbi:hypothetical protein L6164_014730 [Bauhinia variegata]|uniref:Uncharacterized protein n=1 Tax=Bauhinia variegata TaxID=167791 RepID=A0ACB9NN45_BAUVA|nr:hypothetical protein L6164_014730 [Bauhinia variegata]